MAEIRIPFRRKVLYAGIIVLALLVVCEAGLRVRAWMRYGSAATGVRDPMLTYDAAADLWTPRPGYEVKGSKIHIKINSLGFRGDEFERTKPAGTFRIVAIGASTTFSSEVSSNHATWTHLLQEKLRAAYPGRKIEVINAAVGGYTSAENLRNLKHRVLPLDPDLVIHYEANNEIVRDTRELAIQRGLLKEGEGATPGWVKAFSKVSLMFDLFYKNIAIRVRSGGSGEGKLDQVPAELPARFIGVLDQMRAMLAERNVPFVLSTFIVKYRRDQPRETQIANADVAFYYMPWMSIDGMLNAMDVYNQAFLDFGGRSGVPVVDDRAAIPPDAEHFTDCMHLADKGNAAMAERFARALTAMNLIGSAGTR